MSPFRCSVLVVLGLLAGCGTAATAAHPADAEADNTAGTDAAALDVADAPDAIAGTDAAPGTDAIADAAGTDAVADADTQAGTDAVADTSDAAQPDAAADVADTPDAADTAGMNVCQKLGGICASSSSDCTSGGGSYQASGDSGCVFDDGPGACCIPPTMIQAKATCADFGGICAPIAGCNFVNGAYAAYEGCKGIPMICCVPHGICGDENESCCDSMTTYRTACDHGTWLCTIDGTTMKPTDQCPK